MPDDDSAVTRRGRRATWIAALALLAIVVGVVAVVVMPDDVLVLDRDIGPRAAYLATFLFVAADAVLPVLPGETVVNAAAVLASQGRLEIGWIIVAASAGAILGDSALYWLARLASRRLQPQIAKVEQDSRVQTLVRLLGDRAPLFIVLGRYVPGVRFFVNASMGLKAYPYRGFLLWSVIGGAIWGAYTALLAYWVGNALYGYPITSFLVSGGITTVFVVAFFWWEARRAPRATPAAADAG